jgi:hypothetical protein
VCRQGCDHRLAGSQFFPAFKTLHQHGPPH